MDKNFLLLCSYENMEGMLERDFEWYQTEENMRESIEDKKEFIKACINTNRNYIGFELDNTYFELANKRIEEHKRKINI